MEVLEVCMEFTYSGVIINTYVSKKAELECRAMEGRVATDDL